MSEPKLCPECSSNRLYKAGLRYLSNGESVQRWLCRDCGRRFSEKPLEPLQNTSKQSLNSHSAIVSEYRLSAILQEAKKLDHTTETKTVVGDKTLNLETIDQTVKGKLLVYEFWMQKQNLSPETVRLNRTCLKMLILNGANLLDPESTKEAIARYKASPSRKRNAINAYTQFLKLNNMTWEKPKCKVTRKFPFIPLEKELDALIAASGKKNATFLQLLKETAMRSGEAIKIPWKDVDLERKVIMCNEPEKGSNPRIFSELSGKLLNMLSNLPRENEMLFGTATEYMLKNQLCRTRRRLAYKTGNPRLNEIHFHTMRHWKATMMYHYKPDIGIVAEFLGHKDWENTRLYIQLEKNLFKNLPNDQFITRVAHNVEESCKLVEVGFEFVTGEYNDGGKVFRKRK